MQFNRRDFSAACIISGLTLAAETALAAGEFNSTEFTNALKSVEKIGGGKLGLAIINRKNKNIAGYNYNTRFGMCSTFKLPLAAIVMNKIKNGALKPQTMIEIDGKGLKPYSSEIIAALEYGKISLIRAARAGQIYSDNIAANAILKILGGPKGFTKEMLKIGDKVTRLDRNEPKMNMVLEGDVRDTTTPIAMARSLDKMLTNEYLGADNYKTLFNWMVETETGKKRLRAGLPMGMVAGDKTGTAISKNMKNKYNDVALVRHKDGREFIITSYYEADNYYDDIRIEDEAILKNAASVISKYILMGKDTL